MRFVIDGLVALMIVAILAGVVMLHRHGRSDHAEREAARSEVRLFQQQVMLQAALASRNGSEASYPPTIEPAWFEGSPPQNKLLGPSHPWVEVAPIAERHLQHPPDRATGDSTVAGFWYNPRLGVIRCRVPVDVSDQATLDLYNFLNDCHLSDLHGSDDTPSR